jgi:HSP20 family protein
MAIKDLIPWKGSEHRLTKHRRDESPLMDLRQDIDRMFDSFWRGGPLGNWSGDGIVAFPEIDVKETDKEIRVSAELPGLDEKDIHVSVSDGVLSIEGEKHEEHEQDEGDFYHRSERRYGAFRRVIPLPAEVNAEGAAAKFKKGVLKITLPKDVNATPRRRRIEVN